MHSRLIVRIMVLSSPKMLKSFSVQKTKYSKYNIHLGVSTEVRCNFIDLRICSKRYPTVLLKHWYSQSQDGTVDYKFVKKASQSKDAMLIDVREPDEIRQTGKIPNSINIPMSEIDSALSKMSANDFQKKYKKPKPKTNTLIVFYCTIGKRSGTAHQSALGMGYKNAKNYLGSWKDWEANDK